MSKRLKNSMLNKIVPEKTAAIKSPKILKNPPKKYVETEKTTTEYFIRRILSTLILCVHEYLNMIDQSAFMSTLENRHFFAATGIRMIFHIFHMNLIYTKNVDTICCNCQRSMYYYLEYLEQMKKTNALHCLNYLDAIQFVYNKTITKNNDRTQKDDIEGTDMFVSNISKITKFLFLLLWWENTHIDRLAFDKTFLEELFFKNLYVLFDFIENTQNEIESYQQRFSDIHGNEKYFNFLHSLFSRDFAADMTHDSAICFKESL
jgi:hypothetical protein